MKIAVFSHSNFMLHALGWIIVLSLPYLVSDADSGYKIGPIPGTFFTLSGIVHMVIFYANAFFLYPKFLNRSYWPVYVASAILLIVLSATLKLHVLAWSFPQVFQDVKSHVIFPSVIVFIVSVFYCIATDRIRAEKLQKENAAAQLKMELKFLRSQISPHFLFNILTSLVSLTRKKSDRLETSLLMLSGLMRYMLYDAGKKIRVQQEVEYLQSYIALQTLRFGDDVNIVCDIGVPHEEANHRIEPMLLIPFVENAFKHGTGYSDQPFIDIGLTISSGVLDFRVTNKFDRTTDTSKDESSGIGLSNVRTRLKLLYPNRHELVISAQRNLFSVNLNLKLL